MVKQGSRQDGSPSGARADGQWGAADVAAAAGGRRGDGRAGSGVWGVARVRACALGARSCGGVGLVRPRGSRWRVRAAAAGGLGSDVHSRNSFGRSGRYGSGGLGSGVSQGSSFVHFGRFGPALGFGRAEIEFVRAEMRFAAGGPGSRVRGPKSFVQKRRAAARGSGSHVRATGGCVRVRAPWRPLVDRIKSLAPCHEPAAEFEGGVDGEGNGFKAHCRMMGPRPHRADSPVLFAPRADIALLSESWRLRELAFLSMFGPPWTPEKGI